MAVVTRPFKGVPDGEIYPHEFNPGDLVTGDLADVAISEGWAIAEAPADDAEAPVEAAKRRGK